MYEKIEKLIKSEKPNEYLIVMGDWNAVVGEAISGRWYQAQKDQKRKEEEKTQLAKT